MAGDPPQALDPLSQVHPFAARRVMCETLAAAARRAQEDCRYPFSAPQPLSVLNQGCGDSPAERAERTRRVGELERLGFVTLRRINGDGNCFFRAVFLAWVEGLAACGLRGQTPADLLPGGWPADDCFGDLAAAYRELQTSLALLPHDVAEGPRLLRRLAADTRLDLTGVALVRLGVAGFLRAEAARIAGASGGGATSSALGQAVAAYAAEPGGIEGFIGSEVLPMGREAEGIILFAAAMQFQSRMSIVQFSGSATSIVPYVYPFDGYEGPFGVRIDLLYRPGHYEVLYRTDRHCLAESEVLPARCAFCAGDASLYDVLACAHCLCTSCASLSLNCAICADVLPDAVLYGLDDPAWQANSARPPASSAPSATPLPPSISSMPASVPAPTSAHASAHVPALVPSHEQAPMPANVLPLPQAVPEQMRWLGRPEPNSLEQALTLERSAKALDEDGQVEAAVKKYAECLLKFQEAKRDQANPRVTEKLNERILGLLALAERRKPPPKHSLAAVLPAAPAARRATAPALLSLAPAHVKRRYSVPESFKVDELGLEFDAIEAELQQQLPPDKARRPPYLG